MAVEGSGGSGGAGGVVTMATRAWRYYSGEGLGEHLHMDHSPIFFSALFKTGGGLVCLGVVCCTSLVGVYALLSRSLWTQRMRHQRYSDVVSLEPVVLCDSGFSSGLWGHARSCTTSVGCKCTYL